MKVTSSTIPIVKLSFGSLFFKLLNTDIICEGVVSLDESPYLPPTIKGMFELFLKVLTTSKYKGSPGEPGSFVLSKTAIFLNNQQFHI